MVSENAPALSPAALEPNPYKPMFARPTENLPKLSMFRGINPLYAVFLVNQLGIADRNERIYRREDGRDKGRLGSDHVSWDGLNEPVVRIADEVGRVV